jgi:hypothetical protein
MAAIGATQLTPPAQQYYIPLGAAGLSTGAAMTAGANSYIYFVTPVPGYVTSIRVFKASGTPGGTLQAGYTTDLTGATALTTSNFGDSTVTDAASVTLTLPIAKSGVTDDEKPLLLAANVGVGFVTVSAVTSSKIVGVAVTFRPA